jgi:pimeloyl-ACP methyl ester carboxylesterase
VLFVHGNPGSGADWMPLASQVARFATIVAPDLPGFARADKPADYDYTVAGSAQFLHALVEHLGIERVHLVCHDFGGPFATRWAADHPERVASVTMVNTGVMIDYHWHRLARVWRTPLVGELAMQVSTPAVANALVHHDNPGLPPEWVHTIAGHLAPPATKRAVLRLYRSTDVDEVAALAPQLRPHDHPALVVFGADDVYIPAAMAHRQSEAFPHVQIRVLPGLGHWCWLEDNDTVAEIVVGFLHRHAAVAPTVTDDTVSSAENP